LHSAKLSQPYARCVPIGLPPDFRVATRAEERAAIELAHAAALGGTGDPHRRWEFATEKRRRDVDRIRPEWREQDPELTEFIETYESVLRKQGLIDFDDMPLLAYRMVKEHTWIREARRARFS
jgi:DNA helicase-2/ATP-dependent DNA helicase PcrA